MADPFDIYRASMSGAPGAAPAADAVSGAAGANPAQTRALLAMRVQGMMGADAAAASAPAAAPGLVSRLAARLPGLGAVARTSIAAAPVVGALASVADSPESVKTLADQTGMDYDSAGGRIGANAVNFLRNTGNAATFGAAGWLGDKISRVVSGQPLVDPYQPPAAAAPPAAAPAAPAAPLTPAIPDIPVDPNAGTPTAPAATALPPVAPLTAADIRGTVVPASGTGGFVNNATGEVTNLDTRGPGAVEAAPAVPSGNYAPMARFFGAAVRQRAVAAGEAQDLARTKLRQEALLKLPGMQKDSVEAQLGAGTLAAERDAAAAGATPAERAAILGKRPVVKDSFSLPFPPINSTDPVTRLNKTTGAVESVQPTRYASEDNIAASMKAKGLTRAAAIAAYKAQGFDVSRLRASQ